MATQRFSLVGRASRRPLTFAAAITVLTVAAVTALQSQRQADPNALSNPYRAISNWARLPAGKKVGQTAGVDVDASDHVWVAARCGGSDCTNSAEDPILEFDSSGKLLTSFGHGVFAYPHGIAIDDQGNVWVTDARGEDPNAGRGKGQQVFEFSPAGKIMLTLGKQGIGGNGPDTFNQPTDVLVAPNGTVFVTDGHGPGDFIPRIVKFSKDGKFITAFGTKGSGAGELLSPHGMAMDSLGRLFVADRTNNRIQIFDQDGHSLATWKQFGRPSGLFIDKRDVLYVADSESTDREYAWSGPWTILAKGYGYNPGFTRGIRVGSARDGSVVAFIPEPYSPTGTPNDPTSGAEGVAADSTGAIYGAEVREQDIKKYVRSAR